MSSSWLCMGFCEVLLDGSYQQWSIHVYTSSVTHRAW